MYHWEAAIEKPLFVVQGCLEMLTGVLGEKGKSKPLWLPYGL